MITQIGTHKVKHGNVMNGIADLMQNDKADIFYSDPPWGQGNLNYWQTINLRHNSDAQRVSIDYNAFLKQIFDLASKYAKNVVFIEYGIQWREDIKNIGEQHGLIHIGIAHPKYRSGSHILPLDLHIFARTPLQLDPGYYNSIRDTTGMRTLIAAAKPFAKPGGIILDPCCGMGYCARLSHEFGMSFRGNELNRTRLQKTINFLRSKA